MHSINWILWSHVNGFIFFVPQNNKLIDSLLIPLRSICLLISLIRRFRLVIVGTAISRLNVKCYAIISIHESRHRRCLWWKNEITAIQISLNKFRKFGNFQSTRCHNWDNQQHEQFWYDISLMSISSFADQFHDSFMQIDRNLLQHC